MRVRVKLFAAARELAGASEVAVDVREGATLADVECALLNEVPALERIVAHARWAIDAAFAAGDSIVTERAEVALIPPVSGG
jgi:molybdopterin converting factor small subunit